MPVAAARPEHVRDAGEPRWRLNPAVRVYPFDASGGGQFLLELDDESGRTQRLTVSTRVHEVLQWLREPLRESALRARLGDDGWSPSRIETLCAVLFVDAAARRVLLSDSDLALHAPAQPRKPHYLAFMLRLLPPAWVNLLARPFVPLFSRFGLVALVLAGIAGQVLLFDALSTARAFARPSAAEILAGIALTLGVLLGHELGHAAAAWRLGARRVSIGVGWYVLFPVAYADLSEIWRAPARARALVDIAGVLVQALIVLVLVLAYRTQGHGVLLAAATAASLSMLWNLNPLLRLDGYWLLSDLLGKQNLRRDARDALAAVWAQRRGRIPMSAGDGLPAPLAWGLAAYALASTAFFGIVLGLALWRFHESLVQTLPAFYRQMFMPLPSGSGFAEGLVRYGAAIWHLVLFLFLARFLAGLAVRGWRWCLATRGAPP